MPSLPHGPGPRIPPWALGAQRSVVRSVVPTALPEEEPRRSFAAARPRHPGARHPPSRPAGRRDSRVLRGSGFASIRPTSAHPHRRVCRVRGQWQRAAAAGVRAPRRQAGGFRHALPISRRRASRATRCRRGRGFSAQALFAPSLPSCPLSRDVSSPPSPRPPAGGGARGRQRSGRREPRNPAPPLSPGVRPGARRSQVYGALGQEKGGAGDEPGHEQRP